MKQNAFIQQFTPSIKNIIFDLGNVILNIDYNLTAEAFNKLGAKNPSEIFSQAQQIDLFDRVDKGQITDQEFCDYMRPHLRQGVSNNEIFDAWNAMLLDLPIQRIKIVEVLKSQYRTFLLSNTNNIHITYCTNVFKNVIGEPSLDNYFEKTYYSHQVGMRKPDAEIFEFVLKENRLNAAETLFIDDTLQHIEGAKRVGIQAYHLTNGETLEDLFS